MVWASPHVMLYVGIRSHGWDIPPLFPLFLLLCDWLSSILLVFIYTWNVYVLTVHHPPIISKLKLYNCGILVVAPACVTSLVQLNFCAFTSINRLKETSFSR